MLIAGATTVKAMAVSRLDVDMEDIDQEVVDGIAASFLESEHQIEEITIRPGRGNRFHVVAGRHRVLAARKAGWPSLRANVLPYKTAAEKALAELIEIDENLRRRKLSPANEALLTARRKEVFERLHPEAKVGAAQAAGMNRKLGRGGQTGRDVPAFASEQASASGRSDRSVRRAARRGDELGEDTLKRLRGTSLDNGEELDALVLIPTAAREALLKRAEKGEPVSARLELKRVRRSTHEEVLGRSQMQLPKKKFGVVLEDYEWDFQVRSRATGMDRHAANHYAVSRDAHTPEEIVERTLERAAVAAADCAWFAWATVPCLYIALRVMDLRGFRYVSNFNWGKDKAGTGYWSRNKHEHLLIGVRGNVPAPAPGTQFESDIKAAVGEHSAKPEIFYEVIERYFPTLPKIELNARQRRAGWDWWGNPADVVSVAPIATTKAPTPARPRSTPDEDELEIPGFLRRQNPEAPARA